MIHRGMEVTSIGTELLTIQRQIIIDIFRLILLVPIDTTFFCYNLIRKLSFFFTPNHDK